MRVRATISLLAVCCIASAGTDFFSEEDRDRITEAWSAVRYEISDSPDADRVGRWQVRLTPEASEWLHSYNKARGIIKGANLQVAPAQNGEQKAWNEWIQAKAEYDRAVASARAKALNAASAEEDLLTSEAEQRLIAAIGKLKDPGLAPVGLVQMVGVAPEFARAVRPRLHMIRFGENEEPVLLRDHVAASPLYAYYRFPHGVISGGTKMASLSLEELLELREAAGIEETAWRVLCAVSGLEGGFDSINTYDTGFVSVGLIQFTTGESGTGSLGKVLLRMKEQDFEAFDRDFRLYGVDVDWDGTPVVLDENGEQELTGSAAVYEIVEDPRLAAVFVQAGRRQAFRVAQLQVAIERYYPGTDTVEVALKGGKMPMKVHDVVRSEVGLATLMDRKVHTGNLNPLPAVLNRLAQDSGADSVEKLAAQEAQIVAAMKHRKDFSKDPTLSQPGMGFASNPRPQPLTDRSRSRRTGR